MIRVGPHMNTTLREGEAAEWVRRGKPQIVKMMDTGISNLVLEAAEEVGAKKILRVYDRMQMAGSPEDDYMNRVVEMMRRHPRFDAAEGYNECWQAGGEVNLRRAHDLKLIWAMEGIGRQAVVGSFSTGQPQSDYWANYMMVLEAVNRGGHYVGLHEYSAPVMQWGVGSNQWNGGDWRLDDEAVGGNKVGYWTLRYRRAVQKWIELGIGRVPSILITESGIDDISPRPGPNGVGWRDYYGTSWENGAPGHRDYGDYVDQWLWYLNELSRDGFIKGVVDYGWGTDGHSESGFRQWRSFDIRGEPDMYRRLVSEMEARANDVGPAPAKPAVPSGEYVPYTLRPGDTLWSLAGRRWPELFRAVEMGDVRDLPVGTTIFIPKDIAG